jgi:hypothetical protein
LRFIQRPLQKLAYACLLAGLLAGYPRFALASPATFVTALPVAENQALTRFNWNSVFGSQGFTSFQFPLDLGYGLSARWTLFTTLNPVYGSIQTQTLSGQQKVSAGGLGDTLAFARYTLFSRDTPKSTLRIAPLAGLYLPSGSNTLSDSIGLSAAPIQTGAGTIAPYGGVAFGWNGPMYGLAADSTFRHNPITHMGIAPGDQFRVDGQSELRLYPLTLPEIGLPKELWLSIEENYQHDSLSHIAGQVAPGSGGSSFDEDAVFEYATLRYEIGAGIQIPVMQDLNSPNDVREKRQLLFFTEYYFSGFKRHRQ